MSVSCRNAVMFVEIFLMDLILWFLLLCNMCIISDCSTPVEHKDYTKDPEVIRDCIKADCDCGYQPFICHGDGGHATCQPCPPRTFQSEEISSVDINDARRCKPHGNCSLGQWLVCFLLCYSCELLLLSLL